MVAEKIATHKKILTISIYKMERRSWWNKRKFLKKAYLCENLNDMAKRFNTTGNCNPKYHYMVNIDDKLEQIEALINDGLYFTINRARQFGKTTTMDLLYDRLSNNNVVYQISFETDADMFFPKKSFAKDCL